MADNRTMAELLQAPTEGYEDAIDSLNSAAGGNFLDKIPQECLKIIESKSKVRQSRAKAVVAKKNQSSAPAQSSTPAPVKAIKPNCVTCGGAHSYQNCPATSGNVYRDNIQEYVSQAAAANYNQGNTGFRPQMVANQIRPWFSSPPKSSKQFQQGNNFNQNRGGNFNQSNFNQGGNFNQGQLHRPQVNQPPAYQAPAYQAPAYQAPIPQTQSVTQTDFESYIKANDAVLRNMSGTLPSNTITNPKEDLYGITTRSSVVYQGPPIPTPSKVVKQRTEVTMDQVQTPSSQSIAPVQPLVIRSETQTSVSEPVVALVIVPMPNLKSYIPYPSRQMSFEISFTDALILMPKFASTLKALIGNKEKLSKMSRTPINEHCSAVILNKLPRKLGDPGKFLIPCEFPGMDECSALADLAITYNLDQTVRYSANYNQMMANKIDVICKMYSQEVFGFSDITTSENPTPYDDPIVSTTSPTLTPFGDSDFLLFEEADAFLGLEDDLNSPKINPFYYDPEGDILLLEAILNSELLPLHPNHKQYISSYKKELKVCKAKTVKSSVDEPPEGINPEFCTHKILMEEDYKPAVQHQRRVNPKIHYVIKKEVEKLLDAGLIYPISDSLWVSPVHCVPKKSGFTVVENEENELILTRLVIGWKRQRSPVHMVRLPIDECLSVCAMHRARFKGQMCEDTNLSLNWEKSHFMVKEGIVLGHKISKNKIEVDRAKVDVIAKLPHPTTVKGENRASWSDKLDDALWAFRTAYKTPIGCTPCKLVYGKACHLPIKLEHKTYWALKQANFDLDVVSDHQKVQLNELRDHAYENSLIYKEKTKRIHDSKIKNRVFNIGDRVLLFNSRLKIFLGKLKTCWSGPFIIAKVFPYGTVELSQANGPNFKVKDHRVKHYFGEDVPQLVVPDLQTFPMDN
nr:reverse transcriptase domain-containing protein [Tanacetum cinerariifolium]